MNESIEMEEWDEYFKGLLGGVEWRVIRGCRERGEKKDEKKELTREEVREVIRKLKDGKASLAGPPFMYGPDNPEFP